MELPVVEEQVALADKACCAATKPQEQRRWPELAQGARLFRALGDETRLAILRQLRDRGEVCACDLVACCEVAQPTVSHHLKVLRQAGLIQGEKRGLWVYYRLNQPAIERLRHYLP